MQTDRIISDAGRFARTLSRYTCALDLAWAASGGEPVALSTDEIAQLSEVGAAEQVACRRALVAAGVLVLDLSGPRVRYARGAR